MKPGSYIMVSSMLKITVKNIDMGWSGHNMATEGNGYKWIQEK
jgi:hypothetical protein